MKILDDGKLKSFSIDDDKYAIEVDKDNSIIMYKNNHICSFFENIEDFYYYINALTEIAKKIKEEDNEKN